VLDDAHDRHRAADLRIRRRHADEQEHRGERHGADHDRRAPPRVRDEHAVRENEQQPKGKGRWQDAAAGIFQGRAVLEQHKKFSGKAEDNQLRPPQLLDGHGTTCAQRQRAKAQDEHDQNVTDQTTHPA
jgi:hypothetical protein